MEILKEPILSKLLMCLNTPDSKELCPLLHQFGFEVTSTSDQSFALKLLDDSHFSLVLVESDPAIFSPFIDKIKKSPSLNGLLISKRQDIDICPFEKGFLGLISLNEKEKLIFFLKSYFKVLRRAELLRTDLMKTPSLDNEDFIFASPTMKILMEQVGKIAKTQSSVLITGESGTGKEVIAQLIHSLSFRSNHPFVAINSAAISPQLMESELFGFEKGAFTGAMQRKIGRLEHANHGTFFFDEISETPLDLQAKLLRVIQERSFERVGGLETIKLNIRLIAASNRNLKAAVSSKQFREDLYYRLNVVPLHLPPLRERKEDIIPLALTFLRKYAKKNNSPSFTLSPCAEQLLQNYNWPGNIRELSNVIERTAVLHNHSTIKAADIRLDQGPSLSQLDEEEIFNLESLEKKTILKALAKTAGNKTQAAELLGLSVKTLRAKI